MRLDSSHASRWTPRVSLAAAVCAALACLAWSAPALATSAPTVEEEFTTDVASTSATLQAHINPGGEETTYRFEYGTTQAYGSSAPAPDGLVGLAEVGTPVEAHVQGLAAHTTYHYRVVAHSALGTVDGEDLAFTTQAAGGELVLPDSREWEMVSPANKRGALLETVSEGYLIQVAANGDAVTYVSNIPLEAQTLGYADTVQNLAVLGSGGWESRDLTVPHEIVAGAPVGHGSEYRFFSGDLSRAIVQPLGAFTPCRSAEGVEQPCMSPEASESTAFLATDYFNGNVSERCVQQTMRCERPLVSGCPKAGEACAPIVAEHADVPAGSVFGGARGGEQLLSVCGTKGRGGTEGGYYCGPNFVAASPDLSHVVVEAEASLAPGSTPGTEESPNLYEWAAGKLTFVGNGHIGGWGSNQKQVGVRPVSDDGSRVVFNGSSEGLEGLLMRDTATGEAVNLGAGLAGTPSFQAASASGSRVFMVERGELYVFEVAEGSKPLAGTLSGLTGGAGIEGYVLGVSEDGSYVYFVSSGVLAGSGAASSGKNLYVDHYDGSGWKPTFIAALSSEDENDWIPAGLQSLSGQPTRVSPDGEWLAFMSQAQLTGYDNRDAISGRPDAEVYLYDAGANRLVCASCNPTGERPVGVEYRKLEPGEGGLVGGAGIWQPEDLVAANVPGWQRNGISGRPENYQSRYLSNGGRLFFDSADALVPQDVNGTEDVYEYEPAGVGGCTVSLSTYSAQDGGCVGLISSGISAEESAFLDASESGGDVFFLTSAQLVAQDVETSLSLFDARECTARAPCRAGMVVSPPPCETEASCRPAPSPQPPVFGAPASATLAAGGNVATAVRPPAPVKTTTGRKGSGRRACAKGRRLRRGRCVRAKTRGVGRAGNVKRVARGG